MQSLAHGQQSEWHSCTTFLPAQVSGWRPYSKAVASLFDSQQSRADLLSIETVNDHTIQLKWRLEGALNLPGKPRIKPYTGTTIYTTNAAGLIAMHQEEWDISALDAFVSIVWPGFGAPPAPDVQH